MSERNDFGAFLAGLLVGGAIGAILGLLYAPQSGEETRALLREKTGEIKEKATVSTEEARRKAEEALKELRARVEELSQVVQERLGEVKEQGSIVLEETTKRLRRKAEAEEEASSEA